MKTKQFYLLLFILAAFATTALANSVTLQWEPSPTEDVVGYALYYAPTLEALATPCTDTLTENCAYIANVGPALTTTVDQLPPSDWHFAVVAYNTTAESDPSPTVSTVIEGYVPPADNSHDPVVPPLPPVTVVLKPGSSVIVTAPEQP